MFAAFNIQAITGSEQMAIFIPDINHLYLQRSPNTQFPV